MPEETVSVASPIDLLREAAAGPMPADAVEYGITPRALPVTNSDATPMRVQLRGGLPGPAAATPQVVLADILALEAALPTVEWRHFRMAAGRALGLIPHRGDEDEQD
jgi:hypothetical protein